MAISTVTAEVASMLSGFAEQHSRLTSDLDGHNREMFPVGVNAVCRISYVMLGDEQAIDANTTRRQYEITVWSHYRLASYSASERAWTEGNMDTLMQTLASPTWWRSLSGVWSVVDGQQGITIIEPEREGNVITFGVRARLIVTV